MRLQLPLASKTKSLRQTFQNFIGIYCSLSSLKRRTADLTVAAAVVE